MTGVELSPLWIIPSEVIVDYTNAADNDNGQFQEGNANIGLKGTVVDAAWLNAVQTEIVTPIIDNGIALSRNDDNQLYKGINKYLYDKKLKKLIFKDEKTVTINNSSSYTFKTVDCPPNSFVDFDMYIDALCGGVNASVLIRVYTNPKGSGGKYTQINFTAGERKREMHRLVFVNADGVNRKFQISCGTITPKTSLDISVALSGYVDYSNYYKAS